MSELNKTPSNNQDSSKQPCNTPKQGNPQNSHSEQDAWQNISTLQNPIKPSGAEKNKTESKFLRGQVKEELQDASKGDVSNATYELLKFHGSYFGYNRDTATERKKAKLEKEFEFMLRLRVPAGKINAKQYLALDEMADAYANSTIRLTTRETIQYHCIVKESMIPLVQGINKVNLSTRSACGDVVRNLMASPAPHKSIKYRKMWEDTLQITKFCQPRTESFADIFLNGEDVSTQVFDGINVPEPTNSSNDSVDGTDKEPLYGSLYLPRKFKICVTIPEDNSMDMLTHDLGLLQIWEGEELKGYNILIGGGMGMNHNQPKTYPRLATPIGFVQPQDMLKAVEAVVKMQRDWGDRGNRKHARLKYLVEEKGIDWSIASFKQYFKNAGGGEVKPAIEGIKYEIPDYMGWHKQQAEDGEHRGQYFLGIPIPSGRILNSDASDIVLYPYKQAPHTERHAIPNIRAALKELATKYGKDMVITADQNIIIADIEEKERADFESILRSHNVKLREDISNIDRYMMACVALPTCGKALAEAERVREPLMREFEEITKKYGLENERIAIRITGCPNGCARPYIGDIGIVGRTPGHYAIYAGGDFLGTKLSEKIADKIPQAEVVKTLEPFFQQYAERVKAG